jgi:gluconokinase
MALIFSTEARSWRRRAQGGHIIMSKPIPSAGAIVVMGVCGCGKSTVGHRIAAALDGPFLEGDAFHPPANVEKMSRGMPLEDADRWPWLDELGAALGAAVRKRGSAVAACSALKRGYRDRLAEAAGMPVRFVHLTGTRELLATRMNERTDHFMPASLLDSQLATLEPPQPGEPALTLDVALPPERLLDEAMAWLTGAVRDLPKADR